MHMFTCLLTDTRYSVPTLVFLDASSDDDARRMAWRELAASPFRTAFELLDNERPIEKGGR
ncbi:MAG: hypothetical protein SWI22_01055 [Pseudomonadota bacterium]|nr:hypothetical protein [Pseudomonadota bacterium]